MYTPVEVRNALRDRGFKIEQYKNPLASIHTILKRLVKSGELHSVQDDDESVVRYFRFSEELENNYDILPVGDNLDAEADLDRVAIAARVKEIFGERSDELVGPTLPGEVRPKAPAKTTKKSKK